jgi:hypothetical protein
MMNKNGAELVKIAENDYNICWLPVHIRCTGILESLSTKPSPEKERVS